MKWEGFWVTIKFFYGTFQDPVSFLTEKKTNNALKLYTIDTFENMLIRRAKLMYQPGLFGHWKSV